MPRDQKVGLAMGILLVGAVAAFFFRHDQTQIPTLPALKTAAELDRQIATYDRAPYLQSDEPPPKPVVSTVAEAVTDPDFPEPLDGAGLVPDPILDGDVAAMLEPSPAGPRPETMAPARPVEHLVQRGETLSSIAAKYLGNANRYDELYQANADQLRDPNDVHPGMTLRIPDKQKSVGPMPRPTDPTTPSTPRASDIAVGGAQPLSSTTDPKKFVPFSRSPLNVPDLGSPTLDADPKAAAKRRLTLMPPRDGGIIR